MNTTTFTESDIIIFGDRPSGDFTSETLRVIEYEYDEFIFLPSNKTLLEDPKLEKIPHDESIIGDTIEQDHS